MVRRLEPRMAIPTFPAFGRMGAEAAVAVVKVNAVQPLRAHLRQELLLREFLLRERLRQEVQERQRQALAVEGVAAVNAAERAADSAARGFPPTEFPTRISRTSEPVSQMVFRYNLGRPTSSSNAWRTTAKTTPTPTACRWVSCSFTRIRNRER